MNNRQYLKKSILLCGESDGTVFKRNFSIIKKIEEGATAICYEAFHETSGRGVLKEFYPQDAYALERNKQGQLVHAQEFQEAYERFLKVEKEYLEPYQMLLKARRSSENRELDTFIPAFEIYHGCDEDGRVIGSTYIWTPEPKLETFDKICDEIHKHPGKASEHKLITVLTAVESLTRCICALHCADMIHRDIKPSNFGFINRGNETMTQTLSLFDINTVCSVFGKTDGKVGTNGFLEPESGYEAANNQTDIYAIGATLFHAIIVTDEVKANGYLYSEPYYDKLRELVDESALIRASEANSHPRLRNILTQILRKCLSERTYRYANCEELLDDLEIALYYALPSDIAQKSLSGERWVLSDVEKSLDINKEKNSFRAIQYHLYEHPLYQCCPDGEENLNVLIIGFGNYGQKFLDASLQNGQIRSKRLNVTVVSDDRTDREIYLDERPGLAEFFQIDGSVKDDRETYGEIVFETICLKRADPDANADILQTLICDHYESRRPHYIFVALGDDALNESAADACRTAAEVLETACAVSYISENGINSGNDAAFLFPLYVNQDIKKSPFFPEIERMAFNTHLVWEKNLNINYRTVRADFRKTYNHDSCISSVLALKYKLYSIGIDLEKVSFREAASQFRVKLADKKNRGMKNELIWIEHRRWVTEKLCLGWQKTDNLEDCAGGVTKDEKNRRHVCIVRSRPDQKLATEYRGNDNFEKWDTAPESELSQLDELDRMSVELHRMFEKKAKTVKKHNLLSGSNISAIRELIEGDRKSIVAFQEWYSCLKNIWSGDRGKVRQYKGLKNSFLQAAELLPNERKKAVNEQVKSFDTMFYPIMASMEYRDWKQDDVAFIDNIPFVLTYTENAYMVIPFSTAQKDHTTVFGNVSAATVVNPARILYLYLVERKQDVKELLDTIPYITEYMRKKHFKAAVEFILTSYGSAASLLTKEVESEILRLGRGRIRQVKYIRVNRLDAVPAGLEEYLTLRRVGKRFFAVERNASKLSYLLQGAGFYQAFANYMFDPNSMKFENLADCDMLGYIKKAPFITVTDMAAFRLSSSESSNQPEFFNDYRELWKKYVKKSDIWKALCDVLGEYSRQNDTLAVFRRIQDEKKKETKEYTYILPFVCIRNVTRILQLLKEKDIAEPESYVNGYTTDSCKIVIADRCGYRIKYDRLFSNVYALMLTDAMTFYFDKNSHEVKVVFDNLVVAGAQIPVNRLAEYHSLLNYFKDKGYIICLSVSDDGKASFTYATRQIKRLLTTAGKMLEVYTYHKVKELGKFDDVVSSFEIDWENTEVKNEFDCILTKGFRTLFVECKARTDIEQDSYFKLAGLANQFGINATAVLVADTHENRFYDHVSHNDEQRKRGSMMDVVTIWKPDEISNIGQTLLKVINEEYAREEQGNTK